MRALALTLLIAALAPAAVAAVPAVCSYQGKLLVDGQPYASQADFKFALLCGAATLWSNDGTSTNGSEPTAALTLAVDEGIFSVLLGDAGLGMPPLEADLTAACAAPSLRVWVDTGAGFEQLSDLPLASSPFALVSDVAARATSGFTVEGNDLVVRGGNAVTVADAGNNTTAYLDGADGTVRCEVLRFGDGTSMTTAATGGADSDWIVNGNDMSAGVSGNVGIGTTAPTAKLHLSATGSAPELRLSGDGVMADGEVWGAQSLYFQNISLLGRTYWKGSSGGSPDYTIDARNWANALSIDGVTGVVGLHTPTPSTSKTLTLQGVGANSGWLQFRTSAGSNAWHLTNEAGGLNFVETDVAAHRLLLMPGGNVGIGTNVPGARLDVNGATVVRGDLTVQGSISTPNETRTITIGPFGFVEQQNDMDVFRDNDELRGRTAGQSVLFGCPLSLPDGALITLCELFLNDSAESAGAVVVFRLVRLELDASPMYEYVISATSVNVSGQSVMMMGQDHVVDAGAYAYSVTLQWTTPPVPTDIQINGLRITYTMP